MTNGPANTGPFSFLALQVTRSAGDLQTDRPGRR
ncbi:uncharacterized protein METZ01_LOCUS142121 [marine metagenome]|uniref:Uncharacterized protein n=1 Tax=marine metagenome TaxID=408172 RepID=A0A381ZKM0_9ZZZZ